MTTINDAFARVFAQHAEKTALELEDRRLTYAELDREVEARARALAAAGVVKGDRVALWLEKGLEAVLFHLASLRHGSAAVPLNPTSSIDEIRYFLADSGAALLVLPRARCEPVEQGLPEHDSRPRLLAVEEWSAAGSAPRGAPPAASDLAVLLYTSGTTGKPKGAMLTHANLLANCEALHAAWQWSSADLLLHALPLFHVHGLFVALHGALRAGASTILTVKFDAERTLELLSERKCSVFMGVPTMYHRLLQVNRSFDLAHVRLFACGSAPLSIETWRRFRERFGHTIVERYGMTEVGIVTSNPLAGERKEGSVGLPLSGVRLRVVDREMRRPLPAGSVGEVEIGGPSVFAGYFEQPEKTAEALTEDHSMRSGDLGYLDRDGYLFLVGRAKELIISGGLNVYPKEVEHACETHPSVREVAVAGVPDADLGEAVVAAVVLEPGAVLTAQDLQAHLRSRLAPYKCPKRIAFVEALPRNAMGKVEKARIAALPELRAPR